jgi:hypothetical protein
MEMEGRNHLDFWYAVNNTDIVLMPTRHLETFGSTVLNYHLVSELMDVTDQVRVREGRMQASQPKIITPEAYAKTYLEGFGEEAGKYVEWLKEHEKDIRILQYGYRLRQEAFSEHVVTDKIETVVERVRKQVQKRNDPMSAVVVGVDDPWDVCLVKLFWEVIRGSAQTNIRQMEKRSLFEDPSGTAQLRSRIEAAFLAASKNPSLINSLGKMLHRSGLFEEYQDRFFSLIKSRKQK